MEEDSKKLAEAGSFGASIHFHARDKITTREFIQMMSQVVESTGRMVQEKGYPILGHIKAFISTPQGFLKLNLIDMDLGVEETSTIKAASVTEGEIKIMAALVGIPDHEIQRIIGESIQPLTRYFELELEEHHEHHDHNG